MRWGRWPGAALGLERVDDPEPKEGAFRRSPRRGGSRRLAALGVDSRRLSAGLVAVGQVVWALAVVGRWRAKEPSGGGWFTDCEEVWGNGVMKTVGVRHFL